MKMLGSCEVLEVFIVYDHLKYVGELSANESYFSNTYIIAMSSIQ
jgi:hypothetical protein